MVIDDKFTAGMLFAFLAYHDQFTSRLSGVVDRISDFRMLRVQGDRLADIILTDPEDGTPIAHQWMNYDLSIELKDISFGYGPKEPYIIKIAV